MTTWCKGVASRPPPAERGEPNLVQRWTRFVAPGTVPGTIAWFQAHRPRGAREGATVGSDHGVQSIWFEIGEHSRRVEGPSVIPIVAPLPAGRVGIRLEVQQEWKTPHPEAAKIPSAARFLAVSRRVDGGKPRWQLVRSPRRVRRVAHVIDQLPAHQPQVVYGCVEVPVIAGSGPRQVEVGIQFRTREGGPLLAEAQVHIPASFCDPMTLKVGGRRFELEDGGKPVELLRR